MAYDKNYYNDKKKKLELRLRKQKDDFISSVLLAVKNFTEAQMDIKADYEEILKREKEDEEKNSLVDPNGNKLKSK